MASDRTKVIMLTTFSALHIVMFLIVVLLPIWPVILPFTPRNGFYIMEAKYETTGNRLSFLPSISAYLYNGGATVRDYQSRMDKAVSDEDQVEAISEAGDNANQTKAKNRTRRWTQSKFHLKIGGGGAAALASITPHPHFHYKTTVLLAVHVANLVLLILLLLDKFEDDEYMDLIVKGVLLLISLWLLYSDYRLYWDISEGHNNTYRKSNMMIGAVYPPSNYRAALIGFHIVAAISALFASIHVLSAAHVLTSTTDPITTHVGWQIIILCFVIIESFGLYSHLYSDAFFASFQDGSRITTGKEPHRMLTYGEWREKRQFSAINHARMSKSDRNQYDRGKCDFGYMSWFFENRETFSTFYMLIWSFIAFWLARLVSDVSARSALTRVLVFIKCCVLVIAIATWLSLFICINCGYGIKGSDPTDPRVKAANDQLAGVLNQRYNNAKKPNPAHPDLYSTLMRLKTDQVDDKSLAHWFMGGFGPSTVISAFWIAVALLTTFAISQSERFEVQALVDLH